MAASRLLLSPGLRRPHPEQSSAWGLVLENATQAQDAAPSLDAVDGGRVPQAGKDLADVRAVMALEGKTLAADNADESGDPHKQVLGATGCLVSFSCLSLGVRHGSRLSRVRNSSSGRPKHMRLWAQILPHALRCFPESRRSFTHQLPCLQRTVIK